MIIIFLIRSDYSSCFTLTGYENSDSFIEKEIFNTIPVPLSKKNNRFQQVTSISVQNGME